MIDTYIDISRRQTQRHSFVELVCLPPSLHRVLNDQKIANMT